MDFDREYKLYNTIQYTFIDIDWEKETCMVERISNDITTYAREAFSWYYIWFVCKVSFWGHWIKVSTRFDSVRWNELRWAPAMCSAAKLREKLLVTHAQRKDESCAQRAYEKEIYSIYKCDLQSMSWIFINSRST